MENREEMKNSEIYPNWWWNNKEEEIENPKNNTNIAINDENLGDNNEDYNYEYENNENEYYRDFNQENINTYQNDPEDPPLDLEVFYKCYVGRDCSDITDSSLCLSASQCEYINGACRAKCSNHNSQYSCEKDHSCRVDYENSRCTNSSSFNIVKLISIIIISLLLI